jgi:3-oxoacyl-[acyl-carrier-protein] synthase-3
MTLELHGAGHFHPETEISNRFLEELDIGTDDAWIVERVGIRSRRSVLPLDYVRETRNRDPRAAMDAALVSNAAMGARAAELAIARAGLTSADIGLVIAGGSAADTASPAEACNIAARLGIEAPAFDIVSACTSFFAQLNAISWMRPEALPDFVLLVVPEALTKTVDYSDRTAAVLWGDGAAAAVVSLRVPGRARILDATFASSPAGADKVVVPRIGHFTQQGRVVQMFAIRRTTEGLRRLQEAHACDARTLHFIGHQANLRMLEAVCRACAMPPEHHHANVEWYGNTAAAGAPSLLSMHWEKWRETDDVALVGVGSGLSWGGCLVRFGGAT